MNASIEKLLFAAAADLTATAERDAFLDHACRDDPALRNRLDELLKIQGAAEEFFEFQPAVPEMMASENFAEEGLEMHIGRYRLLERLGTGGYGVVYLAEQQRPVHRKVALKIIRIGMDTESVIARFEMERQALALMDHPNIARVLDAGATASGRPYFVMEWVDGEKITDFCDANRLDIRQRLELFVQVCQAIQHAHQKGVIHRDIKPSNVLVRCHDGVAVPKVIDFGIAKATGSGGGQDAAFTAFDQFVGTPIYMSPEQAAGGVDVDTRSDVYSLGVLLYELLSGQPPFDPANLKHLGMDEIRRMVREKEPPSLSGSVKAKGAGNIEAIARQRDTDVHRLLALLKGDLYWIVAKAMEKDRQRRYDTVNGLAMDVLRHLRNEPVSARPPSNIYRLRKLARRNKAVFAAGSVAVSGLLIGFGVSTVLFLREKDAREEQARLRKVAEIARVNETRMREAAELRERVAQAAVRIMYGNLEEADRLLASVPVERMPPSLETVNSLLSVAQWHLRGQRWRDASERFAALANAMTNVDASDHSRVSFELLPAAAVIGYAGETERYERLRATLIERFTGTNQPVVAEQVLKSCLLMPADAATLRRLEPFAKIVEATVTSEESEIARNPHLAAWSCFSLSLMRYRAGDDVSAAHWAERCLAYPGNNAPKIASGKSVLAMTARRAGRAEEAKALFAEAADIVNGRFAGKVSLEKFEGGIEGNWFDWINALILVEEASRSVGK